MRLHGTLFFVGVSKEQHQKTDISRTPDTHVLIFIFIFEAITSSYGDQRISRTIAVCGLVCNDCIAYIATQKNDDKMREKVVEAWSTEKERLKLGDVDCDGCTVGKRLYKFCSVCEVRKCGLDRTIENCAYCDEYLCEKLEQLWNSFRTVSGEEAKNNPHKDL